METDRANTNKPDEMRVPAPEYGHSDRTQKDKDYENPVDFAMLVQDPRIAKRQANAMNYAYETLRKACLIDSKNQFVTGMVTMMRTPVTIAEACNLTNRCRQSFRNMERDGKIDLIRASNRKVYVPAEVLIKILEGKI